MKRTKASGSLTSRTPFLLLRFPRLLVALAFGVLLLVVAVAAYPLFISAQTGHLVQEQMAKPLVTRYGAGILYQLHSQYDTTTPVPVFPAIPGRPRCGRGRFFIFLLCHPFSPERETRKFTEWTSRDPLLGPVIDSALAPAMTTTAHDGRTTEPLRLFSAPEAVAHLRVAERGTGNGAWIPDTGAAALQVHPGDTITLHSGSRSAELRVAGTYHALISEPRIGYWQPQARNIYASCPTGDCPVPTPFAIVDRATFDRLFDDLDVKSADYSWVAPVKAGHALTLDEARSLARFEQAFQARTGAPKSDFPCCRGVISPPYSLGPAMRVGMPLVVQAVDKQAAALLGPGRVLRVAGILVALAVIAAAGVFSVGARRVEAALRFARGTSAVRAGTRALVESGLPAVIGAITGLLIAYILARTGPGGPIAASATRDAVIGSALALGAGLVLLAIVTAGSYLQQSELHRARFALLGRLPWEVVLLVLAVFAFRRLHDSTFIVDPTTHITRPSIDLLLFPVFTIAGLGMLCARLFGLGLRWLRDRSNRMSSWLYLTVHRLAGGPRLTLLLVSASVLCLGVFLETQTVVHSLQTTVDAKAGLFVGSDVQGKIYFQTPQPKNFPLPMTRVTRVQDAGEFADRSQFDLLAVDPDTLAQAAYWRRGLSGTSLQDIARRLKGPVADGLPIAITGNSETPTSLEVQGASFPVRVVARASGFPGMTSQRPLIVIDLSRLLTALSGVSGPFNGPTASTELWVKGDTDRARAALESLRFPPYLIVTADEVKDIPVIAAIIDTFLVLNGLALVAALLVVIGMLMYLQARQRSQVVSYGLSLRMGMSHSRHRRSLVAELGTMLGASFVLGLVLASGVALYLVHRLDPLPTIPPTPLFVSPSRTILTALVAVAAVSWLAGWLTNRRARGFDLGEVMRLAE